MRKVVSVMIAAAFLSAGSLHAFDAAGFTKKCAGCHSADKDATGPSWKTVSAKYKAGSGKAGLVSFMSKKADPIVWPDKFPTMRSQLKLFKKLSDEEKGSLADFILSH